MLILILFLAYQFPEGFPIVLSLQFGSFLIVITKRNKLRPRWLNPNPLQSPCAACYSFPYKDGKRERLLEEARI